MFSYIMNRNAIAWSVKWVYLSYRVLYYLSPSVIGFASKINFWNYGNNYVIISSLDKITINYNDICCEIAVQAAIGYFLSEHGHPTFILKTTSDMTLKY